MYELRVVVDDVLGFCDLPMQPGDYFEVRGGRIYVPEGKYVCMWALQSLMPILPAKQRQVADDNDWLPFVDRLCCPDPDGRVVFRIERLNGKPSPSGPVAAANCQRGRLIVKPELCTSCGDCVRACSQESGEARIRVSSEQRGSEISVCRQCGNARCVTYCSAGALSRDSATGAITADHVACTGCGECAAHCPFDAIRLAPDSAPAVCDLCQGSPRCTEACSTGALRFTAAGQSTCG